MKKYTRRKMLTGSMASATMLAACGTTQNTSPTLMPPPEPETKPTSPPHSIIKPARLVPGDTVMLVSPGSRINDGHRSRADAAMRAMGLNYIIGDHANSSHGYFAGTDEERAADINAGFASEDVKAVIAYRGGWGSARIMEYLDFDLIKANPKIFHGMSDITALSIAITKLCGFVTFNGPIAGANWNDFSTNNFKEILIEGKTQVMGWEPEACGTNPIKTYVGGVGTGELVGGTLTILLSLLGTPYFPNLDGKILFLEDVDEAVYRVDRMMTQLIMAGVLDNVAGIVFGQFTGASEGIGPRFSLDDILLHHMVKLGKPAIYGLRFGHITGERTMPIGVKATLDADKKTLTLLESAVS